MSESPEQTLNYRTVFTLLPRWSLADVIGHLHAALASWLAARDVPVAHAAEWFRKGGRWSSPDGRARVTVRVRNGQDVPAVLAARLEYAEALRRWTEDVVFERAAGETLTVRVAARERFEAGPLEAPEPALRPPPRIVAELFPHTAAWTLTSGSMTLRAVPERLTHGRVGHVLDWLDDPARRCPVVVVSRGADGAPALDPESLAAHAAGAALVVDPADENADHDLRMALDAPHRFEHRAVRIYLPGVALRDEEDAKRHPQLTAAELGRAPSGESIRRICAILAAASADPPDDAVASVEALAPGAGEAPKEARILGGGREAPRMKAQSLSAEELQRMIASLEKRIASLEQRGTKSEGDAA